MINIAFYINNKNLPDIDGNILDICNPGIGGSEYLILLVSSLLAKRNNGISVTLYVQKHIINLNSVHQIIKRDIYESLKDSDITGIDYFIIDKKNVNWKFFNPDKVLRKVKLILWCHNFAYYNEIIKWSKTKSIKCVVNVSKEQYDLWRDSSIFSKSTYIFNIVQIPKEKVKQALINSSQQRENNVVYIGSIVPTKSFHILAKCWPYIIKNVPDANLFVIGNGKLYNDNNKLGKFGITEEDYELKFIHYLTDENGELLNSVHFLGKLGMEKFDYLQKMKVGVPNPTGISETFCLSAVEMQAMGVRVTAMASPGYYDTFCENNIVDSIDKLRKNIVALLKDNRPSNIDKLVTFSNNFSSDIIIPCWEKLIFNLYHENRIIVDNDLKNNSYRGKMLKDSLRLLKYKFPFLYSILPPIELFYEIKDMLILKMNRLRSKIFYCLKKY